MSHFLPRVAWTLIFLSTLPTMAGMTGTYTQPAIVELGSFFSFIRICIQYLGHFSPLPPTPSLTILPLPPSPPSTPTPSLPGRNYFALMRWGLENFLFKLARNHDPHNLSWVARITGVSHFAWLGLFVSLMMAILTGVKRNRSIVFFFCISLGLRMLNISSCVYWLFILLLRAISLIHFSIY
jgi:hypothetical protein